MFLVAFFWLFATSKAQSLTSVPLSLSVMLGHQRSYHRWLDKRIYKTEMKFWAVGAAEKEKLPIAISMQLFGVVFSTFCGQNFFFKFPKNILASAQKSYII